MAGAFGQLGSTERTVSVGATGADRRQFGRRASDLQGMAVLPGHVQLPCTIVNISDGGALLSFAQAVKLSASLRLLVDGTDLNLLCEVRHQSAAMAGVRFVRPAEGIALNRHFQRTPCEPSTCDGSVAPFRQMRLAVAASNRDLRRAVLGYPVAEPAQDLPDDARPPNIPSSLSAAISAGV